MAIRRDPLVLVMLMGALLQGCSATPRFDDNIGAALRANLSAQVIHPAAAANTNPAVGMDGTAARASYERYQRSLKETDAGANQSLVGGSGAK